MSRAKQIPKILFHFRHGVVHFNGRKGVECYRDELIEQVSTVAEAMMKTIDEDCLRLLSELNRDLTNKLYQCMNLLVESEAENE